MFLQPAVLSADRKYRYVLRRPVGGFDDSTVLFIMLNPSTADEEANDPTIRRCMDFARRWGYSWLTVCNLFAYRSPSPATLALEADPVGPENDRFITKELVHADRVIAAWGAHPFATKRAARIVELVKDRRLEALGITDDGSPRHPLYVPKAASLIPWPAVEKGRE